MKSPPLMPNALSANGVVPGTEPTPDQGSLFVNRYVWTGSMGIVIDVAIASMLKNNMRKLKENI
jgi:hypothetical protein